MMREIIFHGKRVDNGEWIEGCLIQAGNYVCVLQDESKVPAIEYPYLDSECGTIDGYAEPVDPDSVGQFTGLTDDDGRRIFEGDIVSGLFRFGMKKNALVTFKDGAFGLEWYRGGIAHFDAFTSICNVKYHVLGNIFDNPELLFKEE